MNKKMMMLSVVTATVLFTGCGGGGGGSASSGGSTTKIISGNVIDPAIQGASVTLNCGSTPYPAYSNTSETGAFSIPVPASLDLSQCIVSSTGGTDADGDSLEGLTLKSAYKLYNNRTGIYVTPLTNAVVEHDDFNTNIEQAQDKVATFFGVSKADLKKDPMSDINILRKTKKITKIAIKKNATNENVGFIDIDDNTKVTQNTFDAYITNDISSLMTAQEKATFDEEVTDIDASTNPNDLLEKNLTRNTFKDLKKIYKLSVNTYDDNLKYLAKKIVEASSSNNKYKKITKRQLRKALLDAGLTVSFKIENGSYTDTLIDSLTTEFSKSTADFKTMLDSKTINILNINQSYQDAKTYQTVVGNDNATRISYYQLINNSNIAKAYKLIGDTKTDDVIDPINAEVSNALARLGNYDEALENLSLNVYTRSELQDAYKNLGNIILKKGDNNAIAAKSFLEEFLQVKAEILSIGQENAKSSHLRKLQTNGRKLGLAGDITNSNNTINYLLEISEKLTNANYFVRVPTALKDLAIANYIHDNNLVNARTYISKAAELLDKVPVSIERDNRTAVYNILNITLAGLKFDDLTVYNTKMTNLLNKYDADGTYFQAPTANYGYLYMVAKSLSKDPAKYQEALADFNTLAAKKKPSPLSNGLAAGMVLNNDIDKLFTEVFVKENFSQNIDYIFKFHLQEKETSDLSTMQILRARGKDDLAELFLDRLDQLTDIATDKNHADYWNPSSSDLKNIYSSWGSTPTAKYGYLKVADWYKKLNKQAKAEAVVAKAINNTVILTDQEDKANGIMNLLWGTKEVGIQTANQLKTMLEELEKAANHADMKKIDVIIKAANYLSSYDKKDKALALVEKAYSLVDTKNSGDLETVQKRVARLVGKYNDSSTKFEFSIANGYFQAGDIAKAKEIITEAQEDVDSLEDTVDQYKLFRDVSNATAGLNDYTSTIAIINKIKTTKERNEAKVEAAKYFANFDAFVKTNAASIDSDGDGKPDFWNHGASASDIADSGLTLDEDIDNDGIVDTVDTLPYDKID